LTKAIRRHVVLLEPDLIEEFNSSIVPKRLALAVSQQSGAKEKEKDREKEHPQGGSHNTHVSEAIKELGLLDPKLLLHEIKSIRSVPIQSFVIKVMSFHFPLLLDSAGNNSLAARPLLTPLQIFVASDDLSVLQTAVRLGFLADETGISQQTASTGSQPFFLHMLLSPLVHRAQGCSRLSSLIQNSATTHRSRSFPTYSSSRSAALF
jgi:hypothetical protein